MINIPNQSLEFTKFVLIFYNVFHVFPKEEKVITDLMFPQIMFIIKE